jgi:hypothetical protein
VFNASRSKWLAHSYIFSTFLVLFPSIFLLVSTYVHIQCLTITSASADRRSHNDQLVLSDKVPNASLFACRLVARVGLDVEFESCNEGQEEGEKELECKEHVDGRRQEAVGLCFAKVVLAVCDR